MYQFHCFRLQKKGEEWSLMLIHIFPFLFAVMLETKRENVLLFATVSVVFAVGVFVLWGPTFRQKRRSKLDTFRFSWQVISDNYKKKKKVKVIPYTHKIFRVTICHHLKNLR
jgi:hypothetical protein